MKFLKQQSRSDYDESYKSADITSIGKLLKAERESQNMSIDSVSAVTRICRPYLEALEEGDNSRLPGHAYIRGIIRLYANHLGLSAEDALRLLDQGAPNQSTHANNTTVTTSPDRPYSTATLPWLRYTIAVVVILSASAYAVFFATSDRVSTQLKTAEIAVVPQTKEQVAVPPAASQAVESKTQPDDKLSSEQTANSSLQDGLVLRLKAVRDGRMHITIDSAVSQEYALITGDVVEWKADKSFQIDLDNAAAVEAELDGKQLAPFGDAGKSAHLVITRTGVQRN